MEEKTCEIDWNDEGAMSQQRRLEYNSEDYVIVDVDV